MKTKFINTACGLAAASIFALALTACDESSPSAPTGGDTNSSAIESTDASSSSNGDVPPESSNGEIVPESSNGTPNSSSDAPESSETPASSANEPASSGIDTPASSSSAVNEVSSSSITFEKCIDMEQMCPPCIEIDGQSACPLTNVACNACTTEGATAPNCKGGLGYVCSDGLWKQIKGEPTCVHITDVDGMSADGNCVGRSGEIVTDCATEQEFKCVDNYWVSLAPPPVTYINENATDVGAMNRGGPAVTPRIVKVQSASGSVTFRDDGVLVDDGCTFNGLNAELRGDTLFATILYPGCTTNGGHMGVITFSLGIDFADVKYIKYSDRDNVKPVFEVDELLPCGNTSSCNTCGGDTDDPRVGC